MTGFMKHGEMMASVGQVDGSTRSLPLWSCIGARGMSRGPGGAATWAFPLANRRVSQPIEFALQWILPGDALLYLGMSEVHAGR